VNQSCPKTNVLSTTVFVYMYMHNTVYFIVPLGKFSVYFISKTR